MTAIAADDIALQHADAAIRRFNTRRFRSAPPTRPERLKTVVAEAITAGHRLKFVMCWGKGRRSYATQNEHDALSFLANFISNTHLSDHSPSQLTIVLTDTHAELNGHPRHEIDKYFGEIHQIAAQYDFNTMLMSEIGRGVPERAETIAALLQETLVSRAEKYYFGPRTDIRSIATEYASQSKAEASALQCRFPCAIYISNNGPLYDEILPSSLPILHLYTTKRGTSQKPWFCP